MWLNEWIVDGDNVDIIVLNSVSEDDTADTTETVDSDLDWCHCVSRVLELDMELFFRVVVDQWV